ncbi:MAG TPA: efflux RND transporter periplasmic adaptor subunit [Melioribacteraceae bacterium]|nr:efflux RND transporter periplasmic adaptor subunit [Melioribacteraceae bacterium]
MGKAQSKKNRKKLFIFGGLGLLLLIIILIVAFSGDKEQIVSVQTEKVKKRTITQMVSATGKINPVYQVVLTPEVTGEIVELPIKEGDKVKKGQLLIKIKPDIYVAQRNRALASLEAAKAGLDVQKANLERVEKEYKRIQGLHEKKLASDSDLETAKSNYYQSLGQFQSQKSAILQSEESLKEQQEQLAKTTIYSPIDGTISALNVELSERVLGSSFSQGTNLMTVANLNLMEATVDVDENDVVLISIGDTAKVKIDAFGDREFIGTVTQIGNSAKSSGLGTQDEIVNFEIKIILNTEGENIRPGMSCDAEIETETKYNVWSVPIQSVTARTQQGKIINTNGSVSEDDDNKEKVTKKQSKPDEVVFSIIDNKAKLVKVKTGISDDTYIEIKEGLDGNEEIVNGPYRAISKELEDNLKVMVQKKGKDNTSKK